VQYVRLYADADGESHFEDVDVTLNLVDFAPPAPPLSISEWTTAERVGFLSGLSGYRGAPHPTPRRQFMVCLAGHIAGQASDGEIRHFHAPDIVLLEDTTGKGHTTWHESDEPTLLFVVQLPN
jgi:hypothetical protein